MPTARAALPPTVTTVRMVWASMIVAVLLLAALVFVVPANAPDNPVLLPVLALVAVVDVAMSFVVPALQLRRQLETIRLEVVEEADPDAEALFRDAAPRRRVFADPRSALDVAARVLVPITILRCALSFTPALLGLVLHMTGSALPAVLPFFALAIVGLALHFPSAEKAIAPLEKKFAAKLLAAGSSQRAA
jgi:hypothetical protein